MEKLEIRKVSSQAKIGGTVAGLAGATLMTIYRGVVVISPSPPSHYNNNKSTALTSNSKAFLDWEWIRGSLFLVTSTLSLAAFYIIQVW